MDDGEGTTARKMTKPTILDLAIHQPGCTFAGKRRSMRVKDLIFLCTLHGVHTGSIKNKDQLYPMLTKSSSQPIVYEGFSIQELRGFIESRELTMDEKMRESVIEAEKIPEADDADDDQLDDQGLRRSSRIKAKTLGTVPTFFTGVEDPTRVKAKESLIRVLETADHDTKFDLLGLPRELRDMVYHLVCQASVDIQPHHRQYQPSISRTCRQVREEALPIYYSSNRFTIISMPNKIRFQGANPWLRDILPRHLEQIRNFALECQGAWGYLVVAEIDLAFHGRKKDMARLRFRGRDIDITGAGLVSGVPVKRSGLPPDVEEIHKTQLLRVLTGVGLPQTNLDDSLKANAESGTDQAGSKIPGEASMSEYLIRKRRLVQEWRSGHGFSRTSIDALVETLEETDFWTT